MIFVYSVVICLTCKRDFSQEVTHANKIQQNNLTIKHNGEQQVVIPNMTSNSVVFRKSN